MVAENPLPYLTEIGKELNLLRMKQATNEHLINLMGEEIDSLKVLLKKCLDHPVKPEVLVKIKQVLK
jgi:hypothetical protein